MSTFSDDDDFVAAVLDDPWPVLGPALFGVSLDLFVLGVLLCQFTYWKTRLSADEKLGHKVLVYWIILGSVAHSGWCQAWAMDIFVRGYGKPLFIVHGWWIKGDCIFEMLLAMPVEAFYAYRAYYLWEKPRVFLFTLPLLFFGFIGIGTANIVVSPSNIINPTTDPIAIGWMACIALLDWILTALIIMALMRKRSGFKSTDKLVMRLVALSAEAQLVPSIVTAGMMVKAFIWPRSTIILMFICVPKIWVFTAMLVINFRRRLQSEIEVERELRQNTFNLLPPATTPGASALAKPPVVSLSRLPMLGYRGAGSRPSAAGSTQPSFGVESIKENEEWELEGRGADSFPDSLAPTLTLVGSEYSSPSLGHGSIRKISPSTPGARPGLHARSQSSPHLQGIPSIPTSPVSPLTAFLRNDRTQQPSHPGGRDEGEMSFEEMLARGT